MEPFIVEIVYKERGKAEPKFDRFVLKMDGVRYDPIPIKFLRISELKALGQMLTIASNGRKVLVQKRIEK